METDSFSSPASDNQTLMDLAKLYLKDVEENQLLIYDILKPILQEIEADLHYVDSIRCYKYIFSQLIERGDLNQHQYDRSQRWVVRVGNLRRIYIEIARKLGVMLASDKICSSLRDLIITILIELHTIENNNADKLPKLNGDVLIILVEAFVNPESLAFESIGVLSEVLKSATVRLHLVVKTQEILFYGGISSTKRDIYLKNLILFIREIVTAEKSSNMTTIVPFNYVHPVDSEFQLEYTKLCNELLKLREKTNFFVQKLVSLLNDSINQVQNPKMILPFLLEHAKRCNVAGIKGLEVLFKIQIKFNIKLQDFFMDLYSFVQPTLFEHNCSRRFLDLLTRAFSHPKTKPRGIVMVSFVKKISRISLQLSEKALLSVVSFLCPFIKDNSVLNHMIKSVDNLSSKWDSFNLDEKIPEKSLAIVSNLWELKTFINHKNPQISAVIKELFDGKQFAELNLMTEPFKICEVVADTQNEALDMESSTFDSNEKVVNPQNSNDNSSKTKSDLKTLQLSDTNDIHEMNYQELNEKSLSNSQDNKTTVKSPHVILKRLSSSEIKKYRGLNVNLNTNNKKNESQEKKKPSSSNHQTTVNAKRNTVSKSIQKSKSSHRSAAKSQSKETLDELKHRLSTTKPIRHKYKTDTGRYFCEWPGIECTFKQEGMNGPSKILIHHQGHLHREQKIQAEKLDSKKLFCKKCSKQYTNERYFAEHTKSHNNN